MTKPYDEQLLAALVAGQDAYFANYTTMTPCPPHKFQPRERDHSWQCAFTYESAGAINHCMRIEADAIHVAVSNEEQE